MGNLSNNKHLHPVNLFMRDAQALQSILLVVASICTEQRRFRTVEFLEDHQTVNSVIKKLPGSDLLFQLTLAIQKLNAARDSYKQIKDAIEAKIELLDYDYSTAQQNLPKDIAKRFKNEYYAEESQRPACLTFWKQAFELEQQQASGAEIDDEITYNNTPAFSLR